MNNYVHRTVANLWIFIFITSGVPIFIFPTATDGAEIFAFFNLYRSIKLILFSAMLLFVLNKLNRLKKFKKEDVFHMRIFYFASRSFFIILIVSILLSLIFSILRCPNLYNTFHLNVQETISLMFFALAGGIYYAKYSY